MTPLFATAVRKAVEKHPDAIPWLFDSLGVFGAIAVIIVTIIVFWLIALGFRRLGEWLEDLEYKRRHRKGKSKKK